MEEPYLIQTKIIKTRHYNKNYGNERICRCGHTYYRHFDSYPDYDGNTMAPIGCKYCTCYVFREASNISDDIYHEGYQDGLNFFKNQGLANSSIAYMDGYNQALLDNKESENIE